MLKQRIITAVLLIVPLVAAVLWLPQHWFALLLGVVVALAAWEWAGLAGIPRTTGRAVYAACIAALLLAVWQLLTTVAAMTVIWLSLAAWLAVLVAVISYERGWLVRRFPSSPMWIIGGLILVPAWFGLVMLRDSAAGGEYWVLFLFVLIWCADSAAYFAGRSWGRHKLAAMVSPGKTLEGLGGALAAALVLILVAAFTAPLAVRDGLVIGLAVLALVTVLMSVLGDLAESLFKRLAGVKDSGGILPGHGGILDRIDSLTAAVPTFVAGLWWLGVVK